MTDQKAMRENRPMIPAVARTVSGVRTESTITKPTSPPSQSAAAVAWMASAAREMAVGESSVA